jgi:murein DD-endopeptidase MepM/ murein hydrolase activator NlpD
MKKNKNKWKQFLQKVRFKYRVTVLNENTLEESWHIRLSRFRVFLYASLFVIITFLILASLIIYTPFRYYLPEYGSSGGRAVVINNSMQVDSLLQQMNLQATYLEVLKKIITGNIDQDTLLYTDTISLKERAEIHIEKSKNEKEFVDNYEEAEKYNLSSLASKVIENIYVFFKPTKGVVTSSFNMEDKQYGVSILTSANESVVSVLGGTVIYAAFTFDYGWVIQVQHDENYVSIYKNNTSLLKKTGDNVKAGEVIAFTGGAHDNKTGNQFYFELWKKGIPINPEEVIIF